MSTAGDHERAQKKKYATLMSCMVGKEVQHSFHHGVSLSRVDTKPCTLEILSPNDVCSSHLTSSVEQLQQRLRRKTPRTPKQTNTPISPTDQTKSIQRTLEVRNERRPAGNNTADDHSALNRKVQSITRRRSNDRSLIMSSRLPSRINVTRNIVQDVAPRVCFEHQQA